MQNNTSYMDINIIVCGLTEFPKHNYIIWDNYSISDIFFFFNELKVFTAFHTKRNLCI